MDQSNFTHEGIAGQQKAESNAGSDDLVLLGPSNPVSSTSLYPEGVPEAARPHGRITVAGVLKLLEWQQFRCALTGRKLTPETASLDHIVPVRFGGKHVLENAQAVHKDVNRAKTTLTNEQFIRLCDEVVEHATTIRVRTAIDED